MKIALLTNLIEDYTGHINVGDAFIRFGLQHILEKAIPEPVEWHLISRFKPLTPEESLEKEINFHKEFFK